ncbi:MAG: sugar-binding domain-containing protein [Nitrososphaeria archaeon]
MSAIEKFSEKINNLYLIAHKYYIENKTQQEIADEMNTNRVVINRFLKQARQLGIVQIKLKGDSSEIDYLKEEFIKQFNFLKGIEIVPISYQADENMCISLMAEVLDKYIKDNNSIGIGWGVTMEKISTCLKTEHTCTNSQFISLTGSTNQLPSYFQTNNIVKRFADAYNSKPIFMFAPFVVDNPLNKRSLSLSRDIAQVIEIWQNLDVIISGIGAYISKSPLFKSKILSDSYLSELITHNVVGDVLTHFFDEKGKFVETDLYNKMINISINAYLKTAIRIGIAVGSDKVQSILGALRGEIINILITDLQTATLIHSYMEGAR